MGTNGLEIFKTFFKTSLAWHVTQFQSALDCNSVVTVVLWLRVRTCGYKLHWMSFCMLSLLKLAFFVVVLCEVNQASLTKPPHNC